MANKSERNPAWSRDETLLALNLYLQLDGRIPQKSDPRVMALSEALRRNPDSAIYSERPTFRNVASVMLKLQNIKQAAVGGGMPNNSKLDRALWRELGERPGEVTRLANLIETAIERTPVPTEDLADDEVFFEGRLVTRLHRTRERDPRLRQRVIEKRKKGVGLSCDICAATFDKLDGSLREAAFEIHHLKPLALVGERQIRATDAAFLCATCHRLIHRLISERKTWITLAEAKKRLRYD